MAVETPGLWKDLNPAWPENDDDCVEGDDHIRLIKASNLIQFPNLEAAVTVTADELNAVTGAASNNPIQSQLDTLDAAVTALTEIVNGGTYTIGDVKLRADSVAETKWLLCDDTLHDPATYPDLFALLGTQFGGDGVSTFGVPDLRGRSPMGFGQGDTAQGGGTGASRSFGTKVGADTHTLTEGQMPSHTHEAQTGFLVTNQGGTNLGGGPVQDIGTTGLTSKGGNQPHNNVSPATVLGFYIKAL